MRGWGQRDRRFHFYDLGKPGFWVEPRFLLRHFHNVLRLLLRLGEVVVHHSFRFDHEHTLSVFLLTDELAAFSEPNKDYARSDGKMLAAMPIAICRDVLLHG